MADTCYGEPALEPSEPSALVASDAASVAVSDVTPPNVPPLAVGEPLPAFRDNGQAIASRQAAGHGTPGARNEPAAEVATTAPLRGLAREPALKTGGPRLALELMTPVIDGGMLMVFGPEGDPVPPQAFADAAGSRPDMRLSLPDGKAVRADRIAAVLGAQALGLLGAAERGDAWILMMLGEGDGPEPVSEDALFAEERDGPEPMPEAVLETEWDRCVLTLLDGEISVTRGGHAFRIVDLAPGASTSIAMRLMLSDHAPISVKDLSARLREQRAPEAAGRVGREHAAGVECGLENEGEAARRPGLVMSGCTIELRPEGLWLGIPGFAASGEGFELVRQVPDGPPVPLVSVVSMTGDAVRFEDVIDLVLADGRMAAAGCGSEPGDRDHQVCLVGGGTALANDRPDRADHLGDVSGADPGAHASDEPALRHSSAPGSTSPTDAAADQAVLDRQSSGKEAPDPIVGSNLGALPRSELDLAGVVAIGSSAAGHDDGSSADHDGNSPAGQDGSFPIDHDRRSSPGPDLSVAADRLDLPVAPRDGEPDDPPPAADGASVRVGTSPPLADVLGGAGGHCEVPHQTAEAVLAATFEPVGPVDLVGQNNDCGPAHPDSASGIREGAPGEARLADGVPAGGVSVTADVRSAAGPGNLAQLAGVDVAESGAQAELESGAQAELGSTETASAPTVSGQVDVDPESIALVVIRGVPEDATLSTGTRDADGSWSISPLDLSSVMISLAGQGTRHGIGGEPPVVEGDLDITGIAFTEHGDLVAISETVPLADYVADTTPSPAVAIDRAHALTAVSDPRMIPLSIDPCSWAGEQFDALVVRDLPPGARLSAGSYDPSIDGWVLMAQDLPMLAIAPPAGLSTDFTLTLMGVALRPGDANAARVLARLPVTRR